METGRGRDRRNSTNTENMTGTTRLLMLALFLSSALAGRAHGQGQGFEDTTFPPPGWTRESVAGSQQWLRSTLQAHSGAASAYLNGQFTGDGIGEDWLITNQITNVLASDELTFWVRKQLFNDFPPDHLEILVSTTDNQRESFTATLGTIDVNEDLTTTFSQQQYSLAAFEGDDIYIAFRNTNENGNGLFLDDVAVGAHPLPVELVAFTATADGEAAVLRWETASETNNAGFEVQHRQDQPGQEPLWQPLGFVEGTGTTAAAQAYTFRTAGLAPGRHVFRLRQVDYDGAFAYSPEVEATVAPTALALEAAYPNPFNPETMIAFDLPAPAEVAVEVFDGLGRRVAVLARGPYAAGRHELRWQAAGLPSGVYLVRMAAAGQVRTQTVTILR